MFPCGYLVAHLHQEGNFPDYLIPRRTYFRMWIQTCLRLGRFPIFHMSIFISNLLYKRCTPKLQKYRYFLHNFVLTWKSFTNLFQKICFRGYGKKLNMKILYSMEIIICEKSLSISLTISQYYQPVWGYSRWTTESS